MYYDLLVQLRRCAEGRCRGCPRSHAEGCQKSVSTEAANAIESLAEISKRYYDLLEKMPRWVSVTERLPKDGEFVLVCNDDKHMMIAKYETETYEWYYKYTNYDFDIWDNEEQGPVCYWMPMPEPPKEET